MLNFKYSIKNKVFFLFFIFLSLFSFRFSKLLILWCSLEIYTVLFVLFIFLKTKSLFFSFKYKNFVLFGLINLFSSIGLLISLFISMDLLRTLFILVKIGRFPFKDWVVTFICDSTLASFFLFFSLNKIIPFVFFCDFISLRFFFILLVILLKWLTSFFYLLNSKSFLEVLCWSSIVRNGYFLLVIVENNNFYWLLSLIIYRFILFFILSCLSSKQKFQNWSFLKFKLVSLNLLICLILLFGVPPISMFLFKFLFFFSIVQKFSYLFLFFFVILFFSLGVFYFIFFLQVCLKVLQFDSSDFQILFNYIILSFTSNLKLFFLIILLFLLFNLLCF